MKAPIYLPQTACSYAKGAVRCCSSANTCSCTVCQQNFSTEPHLHARVYNPHPSVLLYPVPYGCNWI